MVSWTAMHLEEMIQRVDKLDVTKYPEFVALVSALKVEFQAKGFTIADVKVFQEVLPTEADQTKVQELVDEMSLDLSDYHQKLCSQVMEAQDAFPKRSESLSAGLAYLKQRLEMESTALSNEEDKETSDENLKTEITKRIGVLKESIVKEDLALTRSLRVEEKMQNTPKRRKIESPDAAMSQFIKEEEPDKTTDDSLKVDVLKTDGAQVFSEIIQTMAHDVDVFVQIGKVPLQVREGTAQGTAKSFSFIKFEIFQPQAKVRMHVMTWGNLAHSLHAQLISMQDKVVRLRGAKYEFVKKYEEHQLKINEKTVFEKVLDNNILAAFESNVVQETSISKIGECKQYSRINVKGYVRTCDDSPQGPSTNASYWRNFELADASGSCVKGMAWGLIATQKWTTDVTVEMFNVSVRKSDERIQLDEASVIVFKDHYDLSPTKPVFFKPVVWP